MKKFPTKGFTLIELLVVIAIIGILSSVVLASLSSARTKASRAAALATGRGVMPELQTCASDGGVATNIMPTVSLYVCNGNGDGTTGTPWNNHSVQWPALPPNWSYTAPTGALSSNDYSFTLTTTLSGVDPVICSFVSSSCK